MSYEVILLQYQIGCAIFNKKESIMINKVLRGGPVVCAVENNYNIIIPVKRDALISVIVGDKVFNNHSNGIRRSDTKVHKFVVPMELLNKEKQYTVKYTELIKRYAYGCLKGEEKEIKYTFYPINNKTKINTYYISDCHGRKKESINAASYFRNDIDLLILNGDISSSSSTVNEIMLPFDIAYAVTKGEKPCIITRGNHDLRGKLAEKLEHYMPTAQGRTYYYVDLGKLFFLVLDCGEDKDDSHKEYSGTVCFHEFRLKETAYIKDTVKNIADNGKLNIVLSHIPFYYRDNGICRGEAPFNIEDDIYTEWVNTINTEFKPILSIAGHLHKHGLFEQNCIYNSRNINSPILISGEPLSNNDKDDIIGSAIVFDDDNCNIIFSYCKNNKLSEHIISY